jgi:DNA-binding transcriptional ArsR family regulator
MEMRQLAQAFAALGNEGRLKILGLLLAGELTNCGDIRREIGISGPAMSYHLRALEDAGLIRRVRRGKTSCLSLTPRLKELVKEEVLEEMIQEVGDGE